ncbi:basic helix-loop-helix (bHLH) DNA-bindingsuperfamily protein [Striga asiatica]|uniref:Basic helix-loop-helix (BHLH) DNA-bindingsuperfamily protein n=1 Tax=Striga asiatica TaxID=4170 RepID=A0A5A7QQX0_STRAF|nr:basic helix-loop-helix (bHLH) DNA-bindingsuperfamily protein [Striga asiatica]
MGSANGNQNGAQENLRKQLAVAVKGLQWSYAIFWSISDKQPGALEWGDGFYNGDIKTRKTVQAMESNADDLGLERSDQLRELFESLSQGEMSPRPKRPTAALSPEDLTDAEWYFLICMSFVFNIGQGLPGRSLAQNETVWLCNAHCAETKSKALYGQMPWLYNCLANLLTSSVFNSVPVGNFHLLYPECINPGGVMELGTTELVPEDPILIQHVKTFFLGSPSTIFSNIPNHGDPSSPNELGKNLDQQLSDYQDTTNICCPEINSDDFPENFLKEESNLANDIYKDNYSLSSSDCISQTLGNPETNIPSSDKSKANDDFVCKNQECHEQTHESSGFEGNADCTRYQNLLSNLLRGSHELILGPYFSNGSRKSNFVSWKGSKPCSNSLRTRTPPQRLLKKVLFEVPRMHEKNNQTKSRNKQQSDKIDGCKRDGEEGGDRNHVLSERRRREKINERLMILGSLIPSGGKVDKVSILDHTIEYLKQLERKVEELESYKRVMKLETTRTQTGPHEAIERTSGNYSPRETGILKRKACDTDKTIADHKRGRPRDSSKGSIILNVTEKDVSIDIKCGWKEFVLAEVMEAITKLHLDSQTVQSSIADGILSMTIKAKCKEVKGPSASVIRQALQKIIRKS